MHTGTKTLPYYSQLHILVLNCVQISMMSYIYFTHDCQAQSLFSHVLQGSEVLDPVMTRRQSSSSAHPSPSSVDRMELEKLYGRSILSYALIAQPRYLLPSPCSLLSPLQCVPRSPTQLAIGRKLGGGLRTKLSKSHVSVGSGLFLVNGTGTFIRDNYHRAKSHVSIGSGLFLVNGTGTFIRDNYHRASSMQQQHLQ